MAWKVDERIPEVLFVSLMIEKANTIKDHVKKSMDQLIIVANIGPTVAVFKIYDINERRFSQIKRWTLSNLGDIKEKIHQLWQQMNFLLQQYCTQCKNHFSNEIKLPNMGRVTWNNIFVYILSILMPIYFIKPVYI